MMFWSPLWIAFWCVTLHAEDSTLTIISGEMVTLSQPLIIGNSGSNNLLIITNAGSLTTPRAVVGTGSPATANQAIITGPGSIWLNSREIDLGVGGKGSKISVSNGAFVNAGGISLSKGIESTLSIEGMNSSVEIGTLFFDPAGRQQVLNVSAGGSLLISTNLYLQSTIGARLAIAGRGSEVRVLNDIDALKASGTIIDLKDGATLSAKNFSLFASEVLFSATGPGTLIEVTEQAWFYATNSRCSLSGTQLRGGVFSWCGPNFPLTLSEVNINVRSCGIDTAASVDNSSIVADQLFISILAHERVIVRESAIRVGQIKAKQNSLQFSSGLIEASSMVFIADNSGTNLL